MNKQTASSTAESMLMHRAHENTLPADNQIINDPYAVDFLPDRTKKALNGLKRFYPLSKPNRQRGAI